MFASCDQPTTLTDALAAKGLSYTKLARKCGVTQSAVSHWAAALQSRFVQSAWRKLIRHRSAA